MNLTIKVFFYSVMFVLLGLGLLLWNSLISTRAYGAVGLWDASIVYDDNATAIFAWDAVTDPCPTGAICGYEFELRHLEQNYIDKYVVIGFSTVTKTISYKKSGYYKLWMRSYIKQGLVTTYSDWVNSVTNGMVVIGVPAPIANKGWILYWRLPAPTGGGIH